MAEHYFLYPFGVDGTLASVPNPTQISGTVSWQSGFPIGYQLSNVAPGYLSIPRDQFNQILYDVTAAIQQFQQTGFASFITSAANGGTPYSYALGAQVWYSGVPYRSIIANNTDTPPTANWVVIGQNRSLYYNWATDTGSANHIIVAPNPALASLIDGAVVNFRPAFGITGACDINVNGLGAVAIKTLANVDPITGMIAPAGQYQVAYNGNTGFWVLQNPTLGSAAYVNTGTGSTQVPLNSNLGTAAYVNTGTGASQVPLNSNLGTAAYLDVGTAANKILQLNGSAQIPAVSGALLTGLLSGTAATAGKVVFATLGITVQWGKTTATSGTYSGTFATAFSGTPYAMVFNSTVATTHTTSTNDCVTALSSTGYTVTGDGIANTFAFYWVAIGPT